MTLTLDVGNSELFGGVFVNRQLTLRFRRRSRPLASSDELGLFLRSVLRENGGDPSAVEQIAVCSVVPDSVYSLRSCCRKYFGIDPFVLQAGAKTGLKISYRNPLDVGADRVANAIAAAHLFTARDLIIVDLGTATTIDVVRGARDFLGGVIAPGLRISMEALEQNTARLPKVEIVAPPDVVGRSTIECIQSGLYFGHRALIRGLTRDIGDSALNGQPAFVVGTGGFSRLFEGDPVFDAVVPDLVLMGLEQALSLNPGASRRWTPPPDVGGPRGHGVGASPRSA